MNVGVAFGGARVTMSKRQIKRVAASCLRGRHSRAIRMHLARVTYHVPVHIEGGGCSGFLRVQVSHRDADGGGLEFSA